MNRRSALLSLFSIPFLGYFSLSKKRKAMCIFWLDFNLEKEKHVAFKNAKGVIFILPRYYDPYGDSLKPYCPYTYKYEDYFMYSVSFTNGDISQIISNDELELLDQYYLIETHHANV